MNLPAALKRAAAMREAAALLEQAWGELDDANLRHDAARVHDVLVSVMNRIHTCENCAQTFVARRGARFCSNKCTVANMRSAKE